MAGTINFTELLSSASAWCSNCYQSVHWDEDVALREIGTKLGEFGRLSEQDEQEHLNLVFTLGEAAFVCFKHAWCYMYDKLEFESEEHLDNYTTQLMHNTAFSSKFLALHPTEYLAAIEKSLKDGTYYQGCNDPVAFLYTIAHLCMMNMYFIVCAYENSEDVDMTRYIGSVLLSMESMIEGNKVRVEIGSLVPVSDHYKKPDFFFKQG